MFINKGKREMLCLFQLSFEHDRKCVGRIAILQIETEGWSLRASLLCKSTKEMRKKGKIRQAKAKLADADDASLANDW